MKRRLGPVTYRSESKVTTIKSTVDGGSGGIGEASGPFVATPSRNRELRRMGLKMWAAIGFVALALSVPLLSLALAAAGIAILLSVFFASRRNRAEIRLRSEQAE